MILPRDFLPPVRDGGREHDVRYEAETGLWWKYTKPNLAGYTVSWSEDVPYMHNALPLDYLERMLRQNAIFGDDVRLVGLWNPAGHDWRIITTQPHVEGEAATLEQLGAAFEKVGFEVLPWRGIGVTQARWPSGRMASTFGTSILPMSSSARMACPCLSMSC